MNINGLVGKTKDKAKRSESVTDIEVKNIKRKIALKCYIKVLI